MSAHGLRRARALRLIALAPVLCGCSSIGSLTGAVTGAAAGGGSANPAVGYAVAIGSKAAADALVKSISRQRQHGQQDKLAQAAGALPLGATGAWSIRHRLFLFDDAHGRVTAIRDIPNAIAPCREVAFAVLTGKADRVAGLYTTTLCRDGSAWSWAQAEPSIRRWGFLQ